MNLNLLAALSTLVATMAATFPTVSPSIFEAAVADEDALEMRVARLRGELDGVIAPLLTRAREPASTDADSVVGAAVSVLASDVLLRAETAAPDDALIERLVSLNSAVAADTTIPRRSEICNRLHTLIGTLVLLKETKVGPASPRPVCAGPSSPAMTQRRPPPPPPQEPRSPGYDLL